MENSSRAQRKKHTYCGDYKNNINARE